MPQISYPFISFKRGDISRPYVPITICNPETHVEFEIYALVDTGADECAFPAGLAEILGHNLAAGSEKQIQTGNGITRAYAHSSVILLDDFSTEIIKVDYLVNLETPLLGTSSFLSNFIITLDYPQHLTILEY